MYYSTTYPSPFGAMTLACNGSSLVGLWLEGQKYHGGTLVGAMTERDDRPIFDVAKSWLDRYFSGARPAHAELRLAPIGGDFRQRIWSLLCEIPYGSVVTYGDLAAKVAARMRRPTMSCQAVGGAVGHNPISIIIPCHRVVGSGGSLTGYAGGIEVKARLLEREGVDMSRLSLPARGSAL